MKNNNLSKHTQEHKHENCECLCYHCNELQANEDVLEIISLNVGGSLFTDMSAYVQLCPTCMKELEIDQEWLDSITVNQYEHYFYNLVKTFPIENQEYVLNSYVKGIGKPMSREDWINDNK